MTATAKQLLEQVLGLDKTDRVEIADTIYVSVGPRTDVEYEEAWSEEIAARVKAHENGSDRGVDWKVLRAELMSKEEGDG